MRALAPAKINLYLHVVGQRDDGYHYLDSLVTFADVGDVIEVIEDKQYSIKIEGPYADQLADISGSDNIISKAVFALGEAVGRRPDLSIKLIKNLPVASGIGGGSTDAATALKLASKLWEIDDEDTIFSVARQIGQDVPACVLAESCYFEGVGDHISKSQTLPQGFLVLANAGDSVSTPQVFKARTGKFSERMKIERDLTCMDHLVSELANRRNDLTNAAVSLSPSIGSVLDAIRDLPFCRLGRMSGSGGTCFGIFDTIEKARVAAEGLSSKHPDWWVKSATFPIIQEAA